MKRFAIFLIPLLLAGCAFSAPQEEAIPQTTQVVTEQTLPVTEAPTAPSEEITEPCGEEIHSGFYIPGLDVEDVILYFNEVCLDAEFFDSGDPSVLQKWAQPIRFAIHGDPTPDDLETLYGFFARLDTIEGFPPIEAGDTAPNLNIYFCSQEEMITLLGSNFRRMDGGVTFWYQENRIYDAIVCCRTDLDQQLRNSVILEELYNGLGPVQDTALRPDSIIYSEFSTPQELTEIDELILRLLYHPQMECGMTAQQCEEVIRALYY